MAFFQPLPFGSARSVLFFPWGFPLRVGPLRYAFRTLFRASASLVRKAPFRPSLTLGPKACALPSLTRPERFLFHDADRLVCSGGCVTAFLGHCVPVPCAARHERVRGSFLAAYPLAPLAPSCALARAYGLAALIGNPTQPLRGCPTGSKLRERDGGLNNPVPFSCRLFLRPFLYFFFGIPFFALARVAATACRCRVSGFGVAQSDPPTRCAIGSRILRYYTGSCATFRFGSGRKEKRRVASTAPRGLCPAKIF